MWVTNRSSHLKFVREELFPHWGVKLLGEWLWVKVYKLKFTHTFSMYIYRSTDWPNQPTTHLLTLLISNPMQGGGGECISMNRVNKIMRHQIAIMIYNLFVIKIVVYCCILNSKDCRVVVFLLTVCMYSNIYSFLWIGDSERRICVTTRFSA